MITDPRKDGWSLWLGLGLSLAVHLITVYHLLVFRKTEPGTVETQSVTISVNLHATDILDAAIQDTASKASTRQTVTGEAPAPEKTQAEPATEQVNTEEPQPDDTKPAASLETTEDQTLKEIPNQQTTDNPYKNNNGVRENTQKEAKERERKKQEAEERERNKRIAEERARKKREAETHEKRRREVERRKRLERQRKAEKKRRKLAQAQAGARGKGGSNRARGEVSASHGEILNYAARVRARVARNMPASRGQKLDIILTFTILKSGRLNTARISKSSGDRSLDRASLAALRQASPFPKPPKGATAKQRSFTVKFRFR